MPAPTTRLVSLVTVLPLLAAVACSGDDAGPAATPTRTVEAFCAELEAGNDRMRANYEGAEAGAAGQIGMVLANMGEFTRLVHNLDEVAPPQVETEMRDARAAWDTSSQGAADAASDPIKAIASGLIAAVTSSAATRAVDAFSAEHCGSTVFGTVPVGVGADPVACPDSGLGGSFGPTSGQMAYADLDAGLAGMTGSSDPGVAAAAANLQAAVAVLDPEPSFAAEALGRLEWEEPGLGRDLYATLNDAVTLACPVGLVDPELLDAWFDDLAPGPGGDALRTGSAYGRCADHVGWVSGRELLWCEEDGQVAVVDRSTGVVDYVTGEGMEAFDDGTYPRPWPTTDGFAWVSVRNEAASGLDVERWEATLHVVGLDGSEVVSVVVDQGSGEEMSGYDIDWGYAVDDVLVLTLPNATKGFTSTGEHVWTRKLWGQVWWLSEHLVSVDDEMIDARTGKKVANYYGSGVNDDRCGRSFLLEDGVVHEAADGTVTVTPRPDGPTVTAVAGGTLLGWDAKNRLTGYDLDGARTWVLPEGVVDSYDVFGDWLVVTNPSGAKVLVDAATGRDVTAEHPELMEAVEFDGVLDRPGTAAVGEGRVMVAEGSAGSSSRVIDVPAGLCADQL